MYTRDRLFGEQAYLRAAIGTHSIVCNNEGATKRCPSAPRGPPGMFVSQVDDELAKECAAPGGAGVLGALSRIVRRHGKAGLWRGMVPVLLTMGVSNFVYFYCFNGMKVEYGACMRPVSFYGVFFSAAPRRHG